ncbi:MAG: hypothetical protein KDA75_21670, partial [Planctomycetaceae bacterium]|nr:hypothetical protein [Planctomycetaceae bacterium]
MRLKKNRRGTFRWAAGLVVVAMLWSSGRTLPGDDADRATTAASAVTTDRDETSSVDEALDSQHPASEHEDTGRSADSDGSGELDSAGHDVNGHDTGGHEGGEHVNPVAPV